MSYFNKSLVALFIMFLGIFFAKDFLFLKVVAIISLGVGFYYSIRAIGEYIKQKSK